MKFLLVAFFISVAAFCASVELVVTNPEETELFVPGTRETQTVWLEMLGQAKSRIDLEQFYVSDEKGEALAPVLSALKDASNRGVGIRLLVDKKFYGTYPDSVNRIAQLKGAEVRIIDYDKVAGGVQHSKFFIVDGKSSYLGSANFDWRALSHIHEVGLRVDDGGIATQLKAVFDKDWENGVVLGTSHLNGVTSVEANPVKPSMESFSADLRLVASPEKMNPPGTPYSLNAIIDLMEKAEDSISIQVYEYSTKVYGESGKKWIELDEVIRRAARRGVKVNLLVDSTNMKKSKADLVSLSKLRNIEIRTVTIPESSKGAIPYARLVHSKYLIVDGKKAWIGTDNWSRSYFLNSRGVGVISETPELLKRLGKVFDRLWKSPDAETLKGV